MIYGHDHVDHSRTHKGQRREPGVKYKKRYGKQNRVKAQLNPARLNPCFFLKQQSDDADATKGRAMPKNGDQSHANERARQEGAESWLYKVELYQVWHEFCHDGHYGHRNCCFYREACTHSEPSQQVEWCIQDKEDGSEGPVRKIRDQYRGTRCLPRHEADFLKYLYTKRAKGAPKKVS